MYSRNRSLKEPSAKQPKLATKSPLSQSNSSSFNQEMEGKDHSFSIPVFYPWRGLDGSATRLSCQPIPSALFSLAYPLPFPALVPAHYSHSTYSHGIAQYFCWNECSWNASPPGAGWKTRNDEGHLEAADSFPQSKRRPALPGLSVGCSGTIFIVLSYIWHLFATGWFSGWAKASVPLLVQQIRWHRLNPSFSQPLPLLSHAALIRVLLLWLMKWMFLRHIEKSGTQPSARAQILQQ